VAERSASAYIVKDMGRIAAALGVRLDFTPVRSPESTGLAEVFVKTLRRDNARLAVLPYAKAAMRLLPG
jgi:transposase InsO family protein